MNEILKFFKDIFNVTTSSEPVGLTSFNKQQFEKKAKVVLKKRNNKSEISITELMRHESAKSTL